MALPDSTQRRMDKLVDPLMYHNEAQYHNEVKVMQRWLDMTKMAMEDEDISPRVVERVLNRVVYGAPNPLDAYERVDMHQQMRQMAEKMPINQEWVNDLLNGSSGLVHGPHMTNRPYTHEEGLPRPPQPGKGDHH